MNGRTPIDEASFVDRQAKKFLKRSRSGKMLYMKNFNPWNMLIGDCMVRAVSAALMMRYVDVCRHLRIAVDDGHGIQNDGVTIDQVAESDLAGYFHDAVYMPEGEYMTIEEFCKDRSAAEPGSIYVAFTGLTAEAGQYRHAVCVCASEKPYFIDNFNSSMYIVKAYLKVRRQTPYGSKERVRRGEFDELLQSPRVRRPAIKIFDKWYGAPRQSVYSLTKEYSEYAEKHLERISGGPLEKFEIFVDRVDDMSVGQEFTFRDWKVSQVDFDYVGKDRESGYKMDMRLSAPFDMSDDKAFIYLKVLIYSELARLGIPPESIDIEYTVGRFGGDQKITIRCFNI